MASPVSFKDIIAKTYVNQKFNHTFHSYGVEDLINESINKAKNAIGSSCNTSLRKNCYNDVIKITRKKADKINEEIEKKLKTILMKFK